MPQNRTIARLLAGESDNHILPFFWQHGETEEVLRDYMRAIHEANIGAVCVESRPHPDFCGEKWWQDMDVILDEARKRGMKVWILDDSHFPTGFANGALKDYPDCYCRQSICCRTYDLNAGDCAGLSVSDAGQRKLYIGTEQIAHPDPFEKNMIENFVLQDPGRVFDDDRLFSLWAIRRDENADGFSDPAWRIDLAPMIENGELTDPLSGKAVTPEKIRAMANIEQIGSSLAPLSSGRKDYMIVLGNHTLPTAERELLSLCNRFYGTGLELSETYYGSERFTEVFYGISDQKVFADHGIPAVFFTSGITMNTFKTYDTTEPLDLEVLRKRIILIFHWLEKLLG